MAEYRFSALYFKADIEDGSIYIEFSLDVDEDSISWGNIFVMNKDAGRIEPFEAEVTGRGIRLNLMSSPAPDVPYTVVVHGGIKSITGEKIESAVIRTLVFESTVKSSVRIISPANFQKLREIKIKLEEEGEPASRCFYIQIARENAFYSVLRNIELIDSDEVEVSDLEEGQYYIRARAVKGKYYGPWSPVNTFVVEETVKSPGDSLLIEDLTKEETVSSELEEKAGGMQCFDDAVPDSFVIGFPVSIAPLPSPEDPSDGSMIINDKISVSVIRRMS